MPTYEYSCAKCGVFEVLQRMSDEPLQSCPTCGAPVKRLISRNVAVIYKAGGFYTTDNRSKDYKSKAEAEEKAPSAGSTTSSSGAGSCCGASRDSAAS